jgi:hypothetical protein
MNNNFYIYFHVNLCTGKVFYVGKGSGDRAWSKESRNKYWHNIVKKYGYDIQLFEEELSEQEAFEREKYWISRFKDMGYDLANLTDGGEGVSGLLHSEQTKIKISEVNKGNKNGLGYKHSEESKKKMSETRKGRLKSEQHKLKISEGNKGQIFSEKRKENISKSLKGRKLSEETRKKIGKASKIYWENKKNQQ